MPFFGLIFLGFVCGKLVKYPEAGLQWMNFFIVYVAVARPVLQADFRRPHRTARELAVRAGHLAVHLHRLQPGLRRRNPFTAGDLRRSTIQAVAGSYSNIGYMGPGLTIASLGQGAIVPTALIFVFDTILLFTLVPIVMALGGKDEMNVGATAWYIVKRVVTHPFNIATAVAIAAAATHYQPPVAIDTMLTFLKNAAAPCALFTMGVTVALRKVNRIPGEIPILLLIKLVIHPLIVWVLLSWLNLARGYSSSKRRSHSITQMMYIR